jgi:hypothetical protein
VAFVASVGENGSHFAEEVHLGVKMECFKEWQREKERAESDTDGVMEVTRHEI